MSLHTKQFSAIRRAIGALERERRRNFAAGEHAYNQGVRSYEIDSEGVTGVGFAFAEEGHKSYQEYTDAIQELEDFIEILQDPGVTIEREQMEMEL